ncbi:hypothetical protein [Mesorhizobium sp. ES1-4]|nr:hypothetical protein [Mesorhizobium sp. ES1-4]MBZ9795218.1 hypothetical protein [Mesorhizobium sp. ES1-4]
MNTDFDAFVATRCKNKENSMSDRYRPHLFAVPLIAVIFALYGTVMP